MPAPVHTLPRPAQTRTTIRPGTIRERCRLLSYLGAASFLHSFGIDCASSVGRRTRIPGVTIEKNVRRFSREAAQECSPRRKPRGKWKTYKPQRGETAVLTPTRRERFRSVAIGWSGFSQCWHLFAGPSPSS
jgi:hypothetical protein